MVFEISVRSVNGINQKLTYGYLSEILFVTNKFTELIMGIFFDLMQQEELEKQQKQADTLEERVEFLEEDLKRTRALLLKTLHALESHVGKDIDGDGKTG
jgi:hypothetical protein